MSEKFQNQIMNNFLKLTYALFELKQDSPLEELITWDLVIQLERNLRGLKEDQMAVL